MTALLGCGGLLLASSSPDGLEMLAQRLGIANRAIVVIPAPLPDYFLASSEPAGRIAAAMIGLTLVYFACLAVGKTVGRRRP